MGGSPQFGIGHPTVGSSVSSCGRARWPALFRLYPCIGIITIPIALYRCGDGGDRFGGIPALNEPREGVAGHYRVYGSPPIFGIFRPGKPSARTDRISPCEFFRRTRGAVFAPVFVAFPTLRRSRLHSSGHLCARLLI